MRKIILGLVAAAAIATPLAVAGTANAAPAPADKATGSVAWVYGDVTGTVVFNANAKTGGTLDYTNSYGETMHGVVTIGKVVKDDNTVTFHGKITGGTGNYFNDGETFKDFTATVVDGDVDKIGISLTTEAPGDLANVNGGNLTVH